MAELTLLEALGLEKPAPCHKFSCEYVETCGELRMACTSFRYYLATGRSEHPRLNFPVRVTKSQAPKWLDAPLPSREIFDSLDEDDEELTEKQRKKLDEALAGSEGRKASVFDLS